MCANYALRFYFSILPTSNLLTNDYLFRALLQRNNHVLKGLVGALLHLPEKEIISVAVINPIILGEAINEKTFFLDVFVVLNNHTRINLELQVLNEHNWPERSLSYLCRAFNNLNSGEDYIVVRPAIQIGLLNFTLFPDHPEFYSTYQFMNAKNHTVYSDKLQLSVLNLTRKDLATESDKGCHLHHWASFFKATTREELKMLANQDEFIKEASETVYQLSQEELVRLQCEAREDYYRRQRTIQRKLEKLNAQNVTIETQNATIENQNATIESQNAMIEKLKGMVENQNTTIENQNSTIQQMTDQTTSLQEEVASLKELLSKVLTSHL